MHFWYSQTAQATNKAPPTKPPIPASKTLLHTAFDIVFAPHFMNPPPVLTPAIALNRQVSLLEADTLVSLELLSNKLMVSEASANSEGVIFNKLSFSTALIDSSVRIKSRSFSPSSVKGAINNSASFSVSCKLERVCFFSIPFEIVVKTDANSS